MANTSILAAFERLWHHIQVALSNKIEKNTYNDGYIATGTSGGESVYIGSNWVSLNDNSGEGAGFMLESYNENGNPEIHFYGTIGDEPVALGGIATPVNEQDAANKEYVDGKFAGGITSGLYATGSYAGSGLTNDKTFNIGFKPKILIIQGTPVQSDSGTITIIDNYYMLFDNFDDAFLAVEFTNTGFVIHGEFTTNLEGEDATLTPFDAVDESYVWIAIG